eukprot:2313475-Prymnesium_polylepis.1
MTACRPATLLLASGDAMPTGARPGTSADVGASARSARRANVGRCLEISGAGHVERPAQPAEGAGLGAPRPAFSH